MLGDPQIDVWCYLLKLWGIKHLNFKIQECFAFPLVPGLQVLDMDVINFIRKMEFQKMCFINFKIS